MRSGRRRPSERLQGRVLALALLSAAALFMEQLDGTIITTGLPAMANDFHVTATSLNVGITAYLLPLAIFIPASGWMATRFGERGVSASAVLVFTCASVLCGLSRTLPQFVLARILQGLGGSMMVPVGRLMLVRAVPKAQLMRALAYTIWPALTAPILGPVVGGYIIHIASWPWMFLLNVPIGIVLFVLSLVLVQNSEGRSSKPLDVGGFLFVAASCLLLILGLERVQVSEGSFGASMLQAGAAIAAAIAVALLARRHMRRTPHPLFDPQLLRIESFRVVMMSGSLFRMAISPCPFCFRFCSKRRSGSMRCSPARW